MTLIEQKLCRMWAATENSGDWWDLFQRLAEISEALAATGNHEAAELFHEAAYIAIERCMYDIRMRAAA